ncbi:penicillin-binding protein activator [Rhodospira trueperi]|uniref:ABC-type branched-chain amino acid transport system, substrate-binding protein n=1 Tax=Rhodospira trueperi TaxID=69960 RepID=A0A1G7CD25_9PROT|nr:penicillin-binding protein activator [Rhodospira trueperi]SDE36640.1 ABC-type branched-chain amino acid transport system, substrate-binding protein [Rhodospira trueperi]
MRQPSGGRHALGTGPAPRRGQTAWGGLIGVMLAAGLLSGCQTLSQDGTAPSGPEVSGPATTEPDRQVLTPPPAPAVVPVALLLPMSGPQAVTGARLQSAAYSALTPARAATMRLTVHDTGSTPDGARAAAQAAVAEGARLVLGPVYSVTAQAARPILSAAGIPVVALSNNRAVAGDGLFLLGHLPGNQAGALLDHAASQGHGRLVLVAPDSGYARLVADVARERAARGAVQLAEVRLFPPETDYNSQVEMVRGMARLDPTGVLMPTAGLPLAGLAALFDYYDKRAPRVRLMGTDLWHRPDTFKETSLRGAWYVSAIRPPSRDGPEAPGEAATAEDPATAPAPETRSEMDSEKDPEEVAAAEAAADEQGSLSDAPADTNAALDPQPDRRPAPISVGPSPLDRLVMDGVALAGAWARDARSGAGGTDPVSFLTDPAGFRGFSGVFRLLRSGLNERGLYILEVSPEGPVVVRPAPNEFIPGRPAREIVGPEDFPGRPWLVSEMNRAAPAPTPVDGEPPEDAISADGPASPMEQEPSSAEPGAADGCQWVRDCSDGPCKVKMVCPPST